MNQLLMKKKDNQISNKKKKGFTLVELIIVIAIIAVLAAIAIPKFGAVKKDANLRADQANAKIIATAVTTAVANGEIATLNDADTAIDEDNYIKYIDGGVIPSPKTTDATGFSVTYGNTNGVIVKITGGSGFTAKQVYPIS